MSKDSKAQAVTDLLALIKPGQKVFTILRHCSRSGMSRTITAHVMEKGSLRDISHLVCEATGLSWDRNRCGVKMGGCGMDMGFSLVYELGKTLWPNGTKKPHGVRNGAPDSDGGYALKREWL
jgi:hypothetical protein